MLRWLFRCLAIPFWQQRRFDRSRFPNLPPSEVETVQNGAQVPRSSVTTAQIGDIN